MGLGHETEHPFDNEEVDYRPGEWFMANTVDQMQAFYRSRLSAIREAARECGYAIGVHGSERRDFDLMAMPWREGAATPDELAHKIAIAACGITRDVAHYEWVSKPVGRIATSIPVCWAAQWGKNMRGVGHIDLSVMPDSQGKEPHAHRETQA